MKMLFSLLVFFSLNGVVFSAELKDITVLESSLSETGIELKLQTKDGAKDSYFYVDVTRNDVKAFEKLSLAMKKLEKGEDFNLNLRIKSFSASPSGSYYRSKDVVFSSDKK